MQVGVLKSIKKRMKIAKILGGNLEKIGRQKYMDIRIVYIFMKIGVLKSIKKRMYVKILKIIGYLENFGRQKYVDIRIVYNFMRSEIYQEMYVSKF